MPSRRHWSPGSGDIEAPLLAEIQWLARIYAGFTVLAMTVLITRLIGIGKFQVLGVDVPVDAFTAIAVLATLAHYSRASWLRSLLMQVSGDHADGLQARRVLQEVRKSDSVFLRGFIPRVRLATASTSRVKVYVMEKADPTSAVTYGAVAVIFLALLPFRLSHGHLIFSRGWPGICLAVAAAAFCVLNWQAACRWLIPFSAMSARSPAEELTAAEEWDDYDFTGGSAPDGLTGLLFVLIAACLVIVVGVAFLPIWLPVWLIRAGWNLVRRRHGNRE